MKYTLKRKDTLKTTKWDGGSTTELFIYPQNSCYPQRDFQVRISSATVDKTPSTFTDLAGFSRVLMPLTAPLRLVFNRQSGGKNDGQNDGQNDGHNDSQSKEQSKSQSQSKEQSGGHNDRQSGGQSEVTLNPFETARFDGAWKTVSHGICTDIGIMLSPGWNGSILAAYNGFYMCACGFTGVFALCDFTKINTATEDFILSSGDFLLLKTTAEDKITLTLPAGTAIIIRAEKLILLRQ